MASITAPGMGSGLDVNSIISSLMSLEARPIQQQQQKEAMYYTQLSAMGQLRSAVSTFQSSVETLTTFSDLNTYSASSADTAKFSVSADETATIGTYNIQVTALAVANKHGSGSFTDTATIGAAGDKMTVTVGADSFEIEIGDKTLSEIATAINDATDNVGITASVLQESSNSFRLILSSNETGLDNAMSLAFEDGLGVPNDPLAMTETQIAVNSEIVIDGDPLIPGSGYTVTRSSNTISDAITGVTLNLKEVEATNVQLDINRNTSSVTKSVQGFVTAYNELQSALGELSQGALYRDSSISLLERQIQSVFNSEASGLQGSYANLSTVGISKSREGILQLDSSTLSDAVADDLDAVVDLFSNDDQGYAFRLDSVLDGMLESEGVISAREEGINAQIKRSQSTIENLQHRMVSIEARYRSQYAVLDSLMANMTATSSFLDAQLQSLANITSGKK